ncbi:MAG TPA: hypothetical protein IGS40_11925 [Trichormus sp. M33_DOE_039]|nr:hypothetical protein [Trichormus sp. M33_DOE_039]
MGFCRVRSLIAKNRRSHLGRWNAIAHCPRARIVRKVVKIAALIFNLGYHYECFHSQSQTSIGTDR